jgi:hypothetical protein
MDYLSTTECRMPVEDLQQRQISLLSIDNRQSSIDKQWSETSQGF